MMNRLSKSKWSSISSSNECSVDGADDVWISDRGLEWFFMNSEFLNKYNTSNVLFLLKWCLIYIKFNFLRMDLWKNRKEKLNFGNTDFVYIYFMYVIIRNFTLIVVLCYWYFVKLYQIVNLNKYSCA